MSDTDAMGLVEAILEGTRITPNMGSAVLQIRTSIIREKAMCLKVLLAEQDAAREELVTAADACQKHIDALTSLGPGDVDIDGARASAHAARTIMAQARGGA